MKEFKLKNFRFLSAKTSQEKDTIYKLRYEIYVKKLNYLPVNKQKRETDKYDLYSLAFFCLSHQKVVGSIRLVLNNSLGFPLEQDFALDNYLQQNKINRKESIEASRLISLEGILVTIGLFKCLIEYMEKNSLHHIFLVVANKKNHIKYYHRMGFRQIGKPFYYKKMNCLAITMHVNLIKRREEIANIKNDPKKDFIHYNYILKVLNYVLGFEETI